MAIFKDTVISEPMQLSTSIGGLEDVEIVNTTVSEPLEVKTKQIEPKKANM